MAPWSPVYIYVARLMRAPRKPVQPNAWFASDCRASVGSAFGRRITCTILAPPLKMSLLVYLDNDSVVFLASIPSCTSWRGSTAQLPTVHPSKVVTDAATNRLRRTLVGETSSIVQLYDYCTAVVLYSVYDVDITLIGHKLFMCFPLNDSQLATQHGWGCLGRTQLSTRLGLWAELVFWFRVLSLATKVQRVCSYSWLSTPQPVGSQILFVGVIDMPAAVQEGGMWAYSKEGIRLLRSHRSYLLVAPCCVIRLARKPAARRTKTPTC